jgi:hypothetical protein
MTPAAAEISVRRTHPDTLLVHLRGDWVHEAGTPMRPGQATFFYKMP